MKTLSAPLGFEKIDLRGVLKHAAKHQLAWMLVGSLYGFVAAPLPLLTCVLAFTLAGWICCTVLSVLTLPTAKHASLIIIGASCGLLLAFACEYTEFASISSLLKQVCLFVGALVGATSRLWELPLKFMGRIATWLGLSPLGSGYSAEMGRPVV